MKLFDRIGEAGFKLKKTSPYAGEAGRKGNKRVVYINPVSSSNDPRVVEHTQYAYAMTALHELMRHASNSGFYNDRTLALAAFKALTPEQQKQHPVPTSGKVEINSAYFHRVFNLHCRSITGE